jgi:hypothetical protein
VIGRFIVEDWGKSGREKRAKGRETGTDSCGGYFQNTPHNGERIIPWVVSIPKYQADMSFGGHREMTILTTWICCLSKVHKIFQSDDTHYASPGNDKVSIGSVKRTCMTYTIPILNMNITFSFFLKFMRKE